MASLASDIPQITRIESVPSLKLTSKASFNRRSLDSTNYRLARAQEQTDSTPTAESFQYLLPAETVSCNLDTQPSQLRDVNKRSEPVSLLHLSETNSSGEVSGQVTPRSTGVLGPKSILRTSSKFSPLNICSSSKSQVIEQSFPRIKKTKRVTFSLDLQKKQDSDGGSEQISDELLAKFQWSTPDPTPKATKTEKVSNSVEPRKGSLLKAQTGWQGPTPPNNDFLNNIRTKRGRKIILQNIAAKSNKNQDYQSLDVNEQKTSQNNASFTESFSSKAARNFQNDLKNKKLPPILPSFSSIQTLTPIGKNIVKDNMENPSYKDQEILIQQVYIDSPRQTKYKLNTPNVTFAMPKKETKTKSIFASGNIWAKSPDMKETSKIFMTGPTRP